MKIRQKRYHEAAIDNPDLFRVDVHAEYGSKSGWMEGGLAAGGLATKAAYKFYSSDDWEEVPEETWEDVTGLPSVVLNQSGHVLTVDGKVIIHMDTVGNHRLVLSEGWVKIKDLEQALSDNENCLGALQLTTMHLANKLRRTVLLVEKKQKR